MKDGVVDSLVRGEVVNERLLSCNTQNNGFHLIQYFPANPGDY